LIAALGAELA